MHSPDGNPVQGNRELIHNEKGVFHEAKVLKTGNLRLGLRQKDIEEHNVHPPDHWSVPVTPVLALDPVEQPTTSSGTNPDESEDPFPYIDTPSNSSPTTPVDSSSDNLTITLHPIPDYSQNTSSNNSTLPTMSNTQTQNPSTVATTTGGNQTSGGRSGPPGGNPSSGSGGNPGGNPGNLGGGGC